MFHSRMIFCVVIGWSGVSKPNKSMFNEGEKHTIKPYPCYVIKESNPPIFQARNTHEGQKVKSSRRGEGKAEVKKISIPLFDLILDHIDLDNNDFSE